MKFFYDTETSGLPNYKKKLIDPCQPYVIQLAALLTQDDGTEVSSLSVYLKVPDAEIHPDATKAHGIVKGDLMKYGVAPITALYMFLNLRNHANAEIAHNNKFDIWMIKSAAARLPKPLKVNPRQEVCTMTMAKPLLKLPPTKAMKKYGFRYKNPTLSECYEFFFNKKLEGAHDALVDVKAMAKIYFEMKRRQR